MYLIISIALFVSLEKCLSPFPTFNGVAGSFNELMFICHFLLQLQATCNIEQSFFNDWFSGHLNFQIEHQ